MDYKKDLATVQGNEEIKTAISNIPVGEQFEIMSLERTNSFYEGKCIAGVKAKINMEGLTMYTYLPKNFLSLTDKFIENVNAAAKTDEKWQLCFYGTLGTQNMVRLHPFGEGIDEGLLAKVQRMKALVSPKSSPLKRSANDESQGSPSKRARE